MKHDLSNPRFRLRIGDFFLYPSIKWRHQFLRSNRREQCDGEKENTFKDFRTLIEGSGGEPAAYDNFTLLLEFEALRLIWFFLFDELSMVWLFVVLAFSRPSIHPLSRLSARRTMTTWLDDADFKSHPMYAEVRRSEQNLNSGDRIGCIGYANVTGHVRAIGILRDANDGVEVVGIACIDNESGNALMHTITKTSNVTYSRDLAPRWLLASFYYRDE